MNVWLLVLGVSALALTYAATALLWRRRRANPPPSPSRPVWRLVYVALAVVSILIGLKLTGAW